MTYYIIETSYVGPNQEQEQYIDADLIEISAVPARTNSSHEVRIEGWCGTTNDYSVHAHGEYPTLEAALAAVAEKFGDVRDSDPNGDRFESDDEDALEIYRPGKYTPMGREATGNWIYDGLKIDVTADTTDERLTELVNEYNAIAHDDGYTLDLPYAERMAAKYRDDLREEAETA